MKPCLLLIQSLGRILFQKAKQCNTHARFYQCPFQSLIHIQTIQTYSYLLRFELAQTSMPLEYVLIISSLGSSMYTIIIQKSINCGLKSALHPPQKEEEKYMNGIHASSVKKKEQKEKDERCLSSKPPKNMFLHSPLHLTRVHK